MVDISTIPRERFPRHIAIIMDGNGRWAIKQHQPRMAGHLQGATTVRKTVTECARLHRLFGGPDYLTLYSFSIENWKRPPDEVAFLMETYVEYLRNERSLLMEQNIKFNQIGRMDDLPQAVLDEMHRTIEVSKNNTGMTLTLALNYGSRAEITDAVRSIARKVRAGELDPKSIEESTIQDHLYTHNMPDPDLLIRTAGEMRVSNYLLWQISYAELVVSPTYWPEFAEQDLHKAIYEFSRRNRRFGALDHTNTLKK